ncbi:hypothetical protein DFR52_102864 [Hoeflea marina]|uniref:DUF1491 family protein n=1 Tax=Hoeflea marina TaxID=274592 RepID=A0A317PN43_9HYPH|nr:DUF1491 family protein [Hoeflea marina]PWW02196.1 hypothetical protein DFR52_102864 [Hoeflea marina]
MRVTASIFISALLRRVFADGGAGAIERRGAEQAGAVFVRVHHRDGAETLLAPAPQSVFDADAPDDRIFELRLQRVPGHEVSDLLVRELKFDSDIWIVEIETETPQTYLEILER